MSKAKAVGPLASIVKALPSGSFFTKMAQRHSSSSSSSQEILIPTAYAQATTYSSLDPPPHYQVVQMGAPVEPQVVLYTSNPVATPHIIYGNDPIILTCPFCKAQTSTKTRSYPSALSWILCLVICLVGFWCGCCFIPLCVPGLRNVSHYCTNCSRFIGRKSMV